MEKNVNNELSQSIIAVYGKDGVVMPFETKEVIDIIDKKASKSVRRVKKLLLDGKVTPARGKRVEYLCACGAKNTILLKKFLIKERLKCVHCSNDEEKNKNHSLFWKLGYQPRITEKPVNNHYDFSCENEEFKKEYTSKHLTREEFDKLLPNIVSIDGIKLNPNDDISYIEHAPIKNQFKYAPTVYINEVPHRFMNVYLKCTVCGNVFRISDSRDKKKFSQKNIACRECMFANDVFKIRNTDNGFGDNVTYQSKYELMFIEECKKMGVRVMDGPHIPYKWNGSDRTYNVDFLLPEFNLLVETKDEHIWHRQQVECGKWFSKEEAAINYCYEHNLKYRLLFPTEVNDFFNNLRDSLNNVERR